MRLCLSSYRCFLEEGSFFILHHCLPLLAVVGPDGSGWKKSIDKINNRDTCHSCPRRSPPPSIEIDRPKGRSVYVRVEYDGDSAIVFVRDWMEQNFSRSCSSGTENHFVDMLAEMTNPAAAESKNLESDKNCLVLRLLLEAADRTIKLRRT